jgi:hypothetical protein
VAAEQQQQALAQERQQVQRHWGRPQAQSQPAQPQVVPNSRLRSQPVPAQRLGQEPGLSSCIRPELRLPKGLRLRQKQDISRAWIVSDKSL